MPANGIRYDRWWNHGAYENVFKLGLGGMAFPFGDELLDSLWAYSWGMAGAHLGDASNKLVATGVPMSAAPGISRFWNVDATNGAKLLTWENFFLDRDTTMPVSAQLELYPNGDFIARSNNVERLYRRVNPDDWDDDGIPNDEDDEPLIASEPAFGPHQELPPDANTNAYYWVDIVVSNASSIVTFTGDGASALPDPSFIARPGETNRVTLLIGKVYNVTSRMPISCVGRSSAEIEVWQESPTRLSFLWPVTLEAVAMRDGLSFAMTVTPDCLGGIFVWTNSCCSISSSGWTFTYSCNGTCHCTGCCALGCYTYESFSLPASGGSCGCSAAGGPWSTDEIDDDGPYVGGASATFSKSVVIFEDSYESAPDVWVGRHSTTTELHCVAHGGPYGGRVRFEVLGAARLNSLSGPSIPFERDVSAGMRVEFSVVYEGAAPSASADDIVATATFTENVDGAEPEATTNTLTSVKVELTTIYVAPENPCAHRHVYGVGEKIRFDVSPSLSCMTMQVVKADTSDNLTVYDTFGGEFSVPAGGTNTYTCPAVGTTPDITISHPDAEFHPDMSIVEPQFVVTTNATGVGWFWPGEVAMGTLRTVNCIGPMTVSFQGVKVVEIPCTNAVQPTGYFDSTNYTGDLSHTSDAGAGWVHRIGVGNYWTVDNAGRSMPYSNWSSGQLVWKIPIGWKRMMYDGDDIARAEEADHALYDDDKSRPLLIGDSEDAYTQIFMIAPSGESSVQKFGYRLTRSRWSFSGEVIKIQ